LIVAMAAPVALADGPRDESRAAFLRGVSEAHQQHFTAARDAFLEAYRLYPHPSILLNLGIARMRTGEFLAAEEDFGKFLADSGGAPSEDLANARAALQEVRAHIGTLRVRVSPARARATLDGVMIALGASTFVDVRAVVGPGELRVAADGYEPVVRQAMIARDQVAVVDVILSPSGAKPPDARDRPAPAVTPERHATLGWALAGTGALFAVVGSVAGVEAIGLAHDYNTPGSNGYQAPGTRSEGIAWRTSADVLFAVALVTGGIGAYILLRPMTRGPDLHVAVGPGSLAAALRF